jgi:hypothetical protein
MEPFDLAQEGLAQLKQAVIKLLRAHPEGLTNAQIASKLGIRSDQNGKSRDYLSFSVLGILMNDRVVKKQNRIYKLQAQ